MRAFSIIAAAASFIAASALAQNAQEPPATQEAPSPVEAAPASPSRAWQQALVAHLNKYKRFPEGQWARAEVLIRFVLDRSGHVVSAKVEKSSGDAVIDEAALALLQRADPLPQPPQPVTDAELTIIVPIRFVR
jgi:TonB family protein